MNPRYPIYIISKGRASSSYTAKTLEYMNVPYTLVVEPQEYVQYASVINSKKIIVTPFKNLGQGSIPVRNYVWEHAKDNGVKRYWIMDDNIKWFYRLHNHMKIPVTDGTILRAAEDFVDRYENVAIAGLQYDYFAPRKAKINPFTLNTRIYSCILLQTDLKLRWRGRYNEDSDLSIRILKEGHCSILFNAFLCGKIPTLTMGGGNTNTIYNTGDNRKEFAESLQRQHPDIVKVIWKYNRWHHDIDLSKFKTNELKLKKGVVIPSAADNYGMELIKYREPKSIFNYE